MQSGSPLEADKLTPSEEAYALLQKRLSEESLHYRQRFASLKTHLMYLQNEEKIMPVKDKDYAQLYKKIDAEIKSLRPISTETQDLTFKISVLMRNSFQKIYQALDLNEKPYEEKAIHDAEKIKKADELAHKHFLNTNKNNSDLFYQIHDYNFHHSFFSLRRSSLSEKKPDDKNYLQHGDPQSRTQIILRILG